MVRLYPISDVLIFVNLDSVAHTVVFADGRCSITVQPNDQSTHDGECHDSAGRGWWPVSVGRYAYTVDGKFPGTVDVVPFYRSVSLTARTHTIRLGSELTLHGRLTFKDPSGGPMLCSNGQRHPVRVLARHDRSQTFKRIAMIPVPGPKVNLFGHCANGYAWQLKVRPGERTTYIAHVTGDLQYWEQAESRPFTVLIRH